MGFATLAASWDEIYLARGWKKAPPCTSTSCRRSGAYLCRECDRPFCGHCAGSKTSPDDDRVTFADRAKCTCNRCRFGA